MNKKIKTILALTLVIVFGAFFMTSEIFSVKQADAAWYVSGGTWGHRRQIVVDHSRVVATTQSSSSSGPNSPGTAANDNSIGTLSWSNVNNILTSNNSRATVTVTSNNITNYLKATNFGFNVPAVAVIQGITVGIERNRSGGSGGNIQDSEVKLVKSDGSLGSTNKAIATNWVTGEAYSNYGGAADLWGESWTPADINDPDFGVVLSVVGISSSNRVANVDHMRITVTYTLGHPDFPILISSTVPDWRHTDYGGSVASSTGGDILFTAADGTTKLDHEIERYVPTTGELIAWVKVPWLSSTEDTVLYIYYGNASAADQSNPTGLWSGYAGVWHLNESSGTAISESTGNPNAGQKLSANEPAYVSQGQISGAQDFDGDDDLITVAPHASLDALTDLTISAWVKSNAWINIWGNAIINKEGNYFFRLGENPGDISLGWWDGLGNIRVADVYAPIVDRWIYIVGVIQNNDPYQIYIDAVSAQSSPFTWLTDFGGKWFAEPLTIGGSDTGDLSFDGYIDEVRMITAARSAEWIATEYNNQSLPGAFYALGTPQLEIDPDTPSASLRSGSYGPEPAVRVRGGVKFR